MIDENVSWNLGSSDNSSKKVIQFYQKERGTVTYNSNKNKWEKDDTNIDKFHGIGLISPSDYGWTTIGDTEGREACLNKDLFDANGETYPKLDCYDGSWIKNKEFGFIWTIIGTTNGYVFGIDPNLSVYISSGGSNHALATYPTLYLKPTIKIISGDGSENNPYQLVEIKSF